jgi:hypothetical protein
MVDVRTVPFGTSPGEHGAPAGFEPIVHDPGQKCAVVVVAVLT